MTDPAKLPKWNYDGSSTNQATGDNSEVILQYVQRPTSLSYTRDHHAIVHSVRIVINDPDREYPKLYWNIPLD